MTKVGSLQIYMSRSTFLFISCGQDQSKEWLGGAWPDRCCNKHKTYTVEINNLLVAESTTDCGQNKSTNQNLCCRFDPSVDCTLGCSAVNCQSQRSCYCACISIRHQVSHCFEIFPSMSMSATHFASSKGVGVLMIHYDTDF